MSGAPAEIDIVATDDASDVFEEISSNFDDLQSDISEASGTISSDLGNVSSSVSQLQMQAASPIAVAINDQASPVLANITSNAQTLQTQSSIPLALTANDAASPVLADIESEDETLQTQVDTPLVISANDQASPTLNNVTEEAQTLQSSSNIQFTITGNDSASPVLQNAAENAQVSMGQITTSQDAASNATQGTNLTFQQGAMQMNMMAMSGVMLYNGISGVENAEVSLSRAHLVEEKAANAVTLAQQAYNKAVAEYGPNSLQAEDAANKLSLAEQTQSVDAERVSEAQRGYNSAVLQVAVSAIPALISGITFASDAGKIWNGIQSAGSSIMDFFTGATEAETAATGEETAAQGLLNAVMDANPILIVVVAVAALAAVFYVAYEKCAPFREAINEIGSVIRGAVLGAFDALKTAAEDLWNDAIEPGISILSKLWNTITGNPILSALFGPITEIAYVVEHWSEITKELGAVLSWLWNDVLTPVANFFKGVFVSSLDVAMAPIKAFESAINAVASAVKPLEGLIGDLGSALGKLCFAHAAPAAEEFNKQITQSMALSDQLSHKVNTLGSSLQGLSGNVKVQGGAGTSNVNIASPNITIGSVTGSASLKQTRDAVSKGICDAMYKKGLMNKVI